jgi:hypothetical protein
MALDRIAADYQQQLQRLDKTLTDYQAQANRPFEHELRLKELLARQAHLNAALDLDKSDARSRKRPPNLTLTLRRYPLPHPVSYASSCSHTPCHPDPLTPPAKDAGPARSHEPATFPRRVQKRRRVRAAGRRL